MKTLITGGAGFIGSNTANRMLEDGESVVILDNLSRPGSEKNLAWLQSNFPEVEFVKADVRNAGDLTAALSAHAPFDALIHLAAQVAVTTSVDDPRLDFDINALGTLNLLESVRSLGLDPAILFTSTNKVYGEMLDQAVVEEATRYRYADLEHGISELAPLDFHSPYGCSKGTADQYVHDYHRIFGLRTIVFRNSCIYGPRQFGIEDQGWLAWFVIAARLGHPITIYGDGKQVRDVLFVDDLIRAMRAAIENIDATAGQVYNMGGGVSNSLSVWREFGPMLEKLLGASIDVDFRDWRPGDQKIYISDVRKAQETFGWSPRVDAQDGVRRLFEWVDANPELFQA
ncbi:MAG: SDR family NAD(P)-dependent oxidoreductase [Anaerolineales bacterium]|jgi:CDP-paratose 2-epimerase